eukprot:1796484-Pleurochrysis_carterae.AAC.1
MAIRCWRMCVPGAFSIPFTVAAAKSSFVGYTLARSFNLTLPTRGILGRERIWCGRLSSTTGGISAPREECGGVVARPDDQ